MANVIFNSIVELNRYREARYSINMLDVYNESVLLRQLLKKDPPAIYRRGKSTPLVKDGDTVTVVTNGISAEYAFNTPNEHTKNVITFNELLDIKGYVHIGGREVIPDISSATRNKIFTDIPLISNNLLIAVSSLVTMMLDITADKACRPDSVYKLDESLGLVRPSSNELERIALEQLVTEAYSQPVRTPIEDSAIAERKELLESEYEQLIADILEEFKSIVGEDFIDYIRERPCSMYHFDDTAMFFYVDRGMDYRLYGYEYERLSKLEDESALDVATSSTLAVTSYPKFSASYDLF